MRLSRTILYLTLLLAIVFSASCNTSTKTTATKKATTKKAMSGGVDYSSLNIKDAKVIKTFETAKANGKNVLLIFDAVWCGYCRKLNTITMKDAEVQKTLADFEVVNVDVDKYPNVLNTFEVGQDKGVPLIMLFSPEGIQTDEIGGYMPAKPFNKILKKNL